MNEHKVSRVEEELERLVRTGSSGGHWPSESEIRRRSVQRHRRRVGASAGAAVVLVIVIAVTSVAIVGPSSSRGNSTQAGATNHTGVTNHIDSAVELTSLVQQTTTLNSAAEAKVAQAEEEFSLKILGQLVTRSSSANQLVSPFSLSEALAMALLGARGQTATQIAQALGLSKLSQSEQALGWASLDEDLVGAATHDHIGFEDANSAWTQKGFPIEPDFLKNLKSEFGAGVWQTDFDNDPTSAIRSVNAWVSQETDGQIPSLLQPSDIPPTTAAVLLNAVLFEAQWAAQLTNTSSGVFHAPGGDVAATFMSPSVDDVNYLSSFGPDLDALQLPYWNGTGQQGNRPTSRYAALLLMPTSGSLSQVRGESRFHESQRHHRRHVESGRFSSGARIEDLVEPPTGSGSSRTRDHRRIRLRSRLLGTQHHRHADQRGETASNVEDHQVGNRCFCRNSRRPYTDGRQVHASSDVQPPVPVHDPGHQDRCHPVRIGGQLPRRLGLRLGLRDCALALKSKFSTHTCSLILIFDCLPKSGPITTNIRNI